MRHAIFALMLIAVLSAPAFADEQTTPGATVQASQVQTEPEAAQAQCHEWACASTSKKVMTVLVAPIVIPVVVAFKVGVTFCEIFGTGGADLINHWR